MPIRSAAHRTSHPSKARKRQAGLRARGALLAPYAWERERASERASEGGRERGREEGGTRVPRKRVAPSSSTSQENGGELRLAEGRKQGREGGREQERQSESEPQESRKSISWNQRRSASCSTLPQLAFAEGRLLNPGLVQYCSPREFLHRAVYGLQQRDQQEDSRTGK